MEASNKDKNSINSPAPSSPFIKQNTSSQNTTNNTTQNEVGSNLSTPNGDVLKFAMNNASFIGQRLTINQQVAIFQSQLWHFVRDLKYYFNKKTWNRKLDGELTTPDREVYQPPRIDLNAPDLYIPIVSFVTYIILVGFISGTLSTSFTPEVLGMTASSTLAGFSVEVSFLLISSYFIKSIHSSFLDFFAYSGYKYVGIVFTCFFGIFGKTIQFICWLYTTLSLSFFLVKTLRIVFPSRENSRNYFLLFIVFIQFIHTFFLYRKIIV